MDYKQYGSAASAEQIKAAFEEKGFNARNLSHLTMKRLVIRIRRFVCRHHCYEHAKTIYGTFYVCHRCLSVFQDYGKLKMHYVGQYHEVFDKNGRIKK